jgi:diguanylate cyclase (GGDEF)-like protein
MYFVAGLIMLVNPDGYWICSPVKENEWGFMFKERAGKKFSSGFPQAWNIIISSKLSQIHNKKGLFTSATIFPLREGLKSSSGSTMPYVGSEKNLKPSEYYWKIISHISNSKLKSQTRGLLIKLFIMGILLFLFGTIPSWIIAKAIVRKRIERLKLDHLAHFDKLTNVPNRTLFRDRLNEAVKDSTRYKRKFSLMFIDLDNFKPVNDNLGHDVGDEVLKEVAGRLLLCVRSSDTVARIGGDEFTIILHSILEPKNTAIVAKKIIDALSAPFHIKGNEIKIGASVGISIFPENGDTIETLLKCADDAMYDAKNNGKNQYKFSQ